jgi:hypothetical protein
MRTLRLHWAAESGWLLDVPVGVPQQVLLNAAKWAVPKQIDRWRALPAGSKKDELGRAIKLLQRGMVTQNIIGFHGNGKGDIVAFGSDLTFGGHK